MIQKLRTLLAFDYGTKKIGVAVGQELSASTTPLETLISTDEKPDWPAISKLIETWQPDALVVGIPLNMDGSEQDMTHSARRFANKLEGRYHLPVFGIDERLSSIEAKQIYYDFTKSGEPGSKNRNILLDSIAAELILQTFFSEQGKNE